MNFHIDIVSHDKIYSNLTSMPEKQTALVLGALVYSDGRLSDMVYDRAKTAVELYDAGKVQKILVSGDHGTLEYDEVNTIKNFLLEEGVLAEDIFMDHAGFDTYDSLYRAKEIFQVDSLIIVTQEFHLPRAVFIAESLGIDSIGMVADKQVYIGGSLQVSQMREVLARVKAFLDVQFLAQPTFLGDPIPITGDSKLSWD